MLPRSYERLDKLLVQRDLAETRSRAQALILAGDVYVNGVKLTKAGEKIASDAHIEVRRNALPYVSRGGLKLEHAMRAFAIDAIDCVCMDVGASTGGFTDCLLQHGARKVYAVDVGYGQLAWKLRQDPRVIVLERQNIRYLKTEQILEKINLAAIDTSFISLKLVIPPITRFLAHKAILIALIKPQFEAGKEHVRKGGVVKDPAVHEKVCEEIKAFVSELRFTVWGITQSPLLGPRGNREFFIIAQWLE